jgi:putative copper export protein
MESKYAVLAKRFARTFAYAVLSILITGFMAVVYFVIGKNVDTVQAIKDLAPQMLLVFQVAIVPVILTSFLAALDKLRRWVEPQLPEPLSNEPKQ